jgi:hypothetical protein
MSKRRIWVLLIAVVLFTFALMQSQGVFDDRSYSEVPHGSHTHYVPKDCDPPLAVSQSPTREPGPGEHIDCRGQYVQADGNAGE